MAADANHLYWSDDNAGTIWRGNLDGTSPQAIVTGKEAFGVAVSP